MLLAVLLLVVGMFKPKWVVFWMDNPSRLWVQTICLVMFMIGAVLYGNGVKDKQALATKHPVAAQAAAVENDKPAPTQTQPLAPPPPAQAPETSANELRP